MSNPVRFLRVLCVLCVVAAATPLLATTYVVPTDEILAQKAEVIVVASALTSYSEMGTNGRVYTVTQFSITDVVKGSVANGEQIFVKLPGGVFGDRADFIFGAPRFTDGESTLLFLNRGKKGEWGTTDFGLGAFAFDLDGRGRRVLARSTEVSGWDLEGRAHREPRRLADRFVQYLRDASAGKPVRADYVVDYEPSLHLKSDALPITVDAAASDPRTYLMDYGGGSGARWNRFPQVTNFYNANTLAGATNGGVDAIRTGLASWTDDPNSNVNYQYGGSNPAATAGLAGADDGINSVNFERDLNRVTSGIAPFSCASGGVVALGGLSARGSHTFNGQTYWTGSEGDVEYNVGIANCAWFIGSGSFNTASVHELGHTLGFRHSNQGRVTGTACGAPLECASTAVMFESVISSLNGVLQEYDRNAVRAVYPGTTPTPTPTPTPTRRTRADFDGDGATDVSIFRPGQGGWYLRAGSGAITTILNWGVSASDIAAPADYDGDGKSDVAVFRRGEGGWYIRRSTDGGTTFIGNWGMGVSDEPVAADYDGDGRADVAVFRPGTGEWFIRRSTDGGMTLISNWGMGASDIPVPADYDGDGRADAAVFRPNEGGWYIRRSSDAGTTFIPNWGMGATDIPVPADYDGDHRADAAVFRPGAGDWYIRRSTDAGLTLISRWGIGTNDIPAVGDYDGDGRADAAVFRPIEGGWYARRSVDGSAFVITNFGPLANDKPLPRYAR